MKADGGVIDQDHKNLIEIINRFEDVEYVLQPR